jgi:hypothetical protein
VSAIFLRFMGLVNVAAVMAPQPGGGGGPTGDGLLLEDGTSFLLAENSDFIILE